jgi:PAS domain S-box-containing protein
MSESARLQLVSEEAASVPPPAWTVGHDVQFYEAEEFLYDIVGEFLSDGVKAAQPFVVIATPAHRRAFAQRMRALQVDPDELMDGRDAVWLDARETLQAFMEKGMPNPEMFRATVGSVFDSLLKNRGYLVVRAYGEMVDLLWKDGNIEGAIALEDLWNDLAVKYSFSLLCAYSMSNFYKEAHTERFRDICARHGRIVPAESYQQTSDVDRLKQIAMLQQRTRVLEAEVAYHRHVEVALLDTLQQRRVIEDALRDSEQKLRDFLDRAPEGIHWVGPDGIIMWANRHELEMLGYERDAYVGKHIMQFHADRSAAEEMLARLARGEPLRDFAATMLASDGRHVRVLVNSNVVWEGDRFVHTRCFTRMVPDDVA